MMRISIDHVVKLEGVTGVARDAGVDRSVAVNVRLEGMPPHDSIYFRLTPQEARTLAGMLDSAANEIEAVKVSG